MFRIFTRASGPVFEPDADAHVRDMIEGVRNDVMGETRDLVFQLGSVESFRSHPTMLWENSLAVIDFSYAEATLSDAAIYRCWLEGDGSRNLVTRFKGYWSFRRAFDKMRFRAVDIADSAADRLAAFFNA